MKDYHEQSYYELLEVQSNASFDEILNAYKRARSTYSSNSPALYSLFDKSEAEQLLKLIDEAYSVLSNQFKRTAYDKERLKNQLQGDEMQNTTTSDKLQKTKTTSQAPSKMSAVEEHKSFNKAYKQLQGVKGVLIKSSAQLKNEPGKTRFGNYEVSADFEKQIQEETIYSGEFLQKIRLYKNITLDQVSEFTKVSRSYLIAIENDDYTCLPAVVFLRGFLSQYAKALELDQAKVTQSYLQKMQGMRKP